MNRFIGGAEQTDRPPLLDAQKSNSCIHFRGVKEFSLPLLMLSYYCCLEVLIYLWGAPETEDCKTANPEENPWLWKKQA